MIAYVERVEIIRVSSNNGHESPQCASNQKRTRLWSNDSRRRSRKSGDSPWKNSILSSPSQRRFANANQRRLISHVKTFRSGYRDAMYLVVSPTKVPVSTKVEIPHTLIISSTRVCNIGSPCNGSYSFPKRAIRRARLLSDQLFPRDLTLDVIPSVFPFVVFSGHQPRLNIWACSPQVRNAQHRSFRPLVQVAD